MMAETRVHVTGLRELQEKLRNFAPNIARNGLRAATAAGAALIRNEARANAGKGGKFPQVITGEMQRDIQIKRERDSTDFRALYSVFVRSGKKSRLSGKGRNVGKDSYYWRFVEFGHWINPGKALGGNKKDEARDRRIAGGQNKFVTAKSFMRPAYESKKEAAVLAIRDKLAARIAEEAAKP